MNFVACSYNAEIIGKSTLLYVFLLKSAAIFSSLSQIISIEPEAKAKRWRQEKRSPLAHTHSIRLHAMHIHFLCHTRIYSWLSLVWFKMRWRTKQLTNLHNRFRCVPYTRLEFYFQNRAFCVKRLDDTRFLIKVCQCVQHTTRAHFCVQTFNATYD